MLLNCGAGEALGSPLDSKEIKPVNPKGNQPWIIIGNTDAEAPIFWPSDTKSQPVVKDPDAGKDWGQEEKRRTEDEMVAWHHQLNGHEFEQTPGTSKGKHAKEAWHAWGHKESDTTEQLNNDNCGQQLLRRSGVALIVNRRVWNAGPGCSLKNNRKILVPFQGKPFNITLIKSMPQPLMLKKLKLTGSMKTYKTF